MSEVNNLEIERLRMNAPIDYEELSERYSVENINRF